MPQIANSYVKRYKMNPDGTTAWDEKTGSYIFEEIDPDQIRIERSFMSCGVSAVYGLNCTPEVFVKLILGPRVKPNRVQREAFIMFSDIASASGDGIFKYISDRPWLGPIIRTQAKRNPNSGNMVRVYLWNPNYEDEDILKAISGRFTSTLFARPEPKNTAEKE